MPSFRIVSGSNVKLNTTDFVGGSGILDNFSIDAQKAFKDINDRLELVTQEFDGLMSSQDKIKLDNLESGYKITTFKGLVSSDKLVLPTKALGDLIHNLSLIFDNNTTNVFKEVTCSLDTTGLEVQYDTLDNLNGTYAMVSYLSKV